MAASGRMEMHCLDPKTDYSFKTDDVGGDIDRGYGSLFVGWEMTIIASVTGAIALLAFLV